MLHFLVLHPCNLFVAYKQDMLQDWITCTNHTLPLQKPTNWHMSIGYNLAKIQVSNCPGEKTITLVQNIKFSPGQLLEDHPK